MTFFFFFFTIVGMADYQVLPPGLNTENYGRLLVNPSDFQMKGSLTYSVNTHIFPWWLRKIFLIYRSPDFRSLKCAKLLSSVSTCGVMLSLLKYWVLEFLFYDWIKCLNNLQNLWMMTFLIVTFHLSYHHCAFQSLTGLLCMSIPTFDTVNANSFIF